jgi:hypothetical protein
MGFRQLNDAQVLNAVALKELPREDDLAIHYLVGRFQAKQLRPCSKADEYINDSSAAPHSNGANKI